MEHVHVLVDESSHPSWAELFDEFGDLQEHELRETESLFHTTQKLIMEHPEEILNVARKFISVLEEISIIS